MEEDFFTLLGLENLSDQEKEEISETLSKTVHAKVYAKLMETLSQEEQEKFENLAPEDMIPFLMELGFDLPTLIIEESINYRLEVASIYGIVVAPLQADQRARTATAAIPAAN